MTRVLKVVLATSRMSGLSVKSSMLDPSSSDDNEKKKTAGERHARNGSAEDPGIAKLGGGRYASLSHNSTIWLCDVWES
jgi:hypothetical protein